MLGGWDVQIFENATYLFCTLLFIELTFWGTFNSVDVVAKYAEISQFFNLIYGILVDDFGRIWPNRAEKVESFSRQCH